MSADPKLVFLSLLGAISSDSEVPLAGCNSGNDKDFCQSVYHCFTNHDICYLQPTSDRLLRMHNRTFEIIDH